MTIMIWIGLAVSLMGLAGVIWCIRKAYWLKRAELDDAAAQAEINKLIFGHTAAIGVAFLGLAVLAAGLFLA